MVCFGCAASRLRKVTKMDSHESLVRRVWRSHMQTSFKRNAAFLVLSQVLNAGSVFLFWLLCARLFDPATVGLATAYISFGILAATFTHMGLPNTVARFMPTSKRPAGLLYAALLAVLLMSVVGGVAAWLLLGTVAPELAFVRGNSLLSGLLVVLVAATALMPLLDNAAMAFRKGEFVLIKAVALALPRVLVPFTVAHAALSGIVGAYVLLLAAGVTLAFYLVRTRLLGDKPVRPSFAELQRHARFTAGNYIGNVAGILPATVVPIIVLNQLGAQQAAYYYMPMQLAVFLGVLASSTASALVSEASQHEDPQRHKAQLLHALRHLFRMLVPAAALLAIAGWAILRLYGAPYSANGYVPLLVLCVASLFVGLNWLGDTWLIICKRMQAFFVMNITNAVLVLVGVFVGSMHGLVGVSLGWLAGQLCTAVVFGVLLVPRSSWRLPLSR